MYRQALAAVLYDSLAASGVLAAVSPEVAAKPGKELTPTGMEMAGNADGSISPWNPKGPPIPSDVKSHYAAPCGAHDALHGIYNLNSKAIPGKYRNGVIQEDKYFSPKGMARSGVR